MSLDDRIQEAEKQLEYAKRASHIVTPRDVHVAELELRILKLEKRIELIEGLAGKSIAMDAYFGNTDSLEMLKRHITERQTQPAPVPRTGSPFREVAPQIREDQVVAENKL